MWQEYKNKSEPMGTCPNNSVENSTTIGVDK